LILSTDYAQSVYARIHLFFIFAGLFVIRFIVKFSNQIESWFPLSNAFLKSIAVENQFDRAVFFILVHFLNFSFYILFH